MLQEKIVLIHLSDIHFRREHSETIYDKDKDVRNQLEIDIEKMRQRFGVFTGVLITGDIAFGGKKEEYQTAVEWLQKFCDRAGCSLENVWTVPGNHDVDRSIIDESTTLQDCREQFRRIPVEDIDREIQRYMGDTLTRKVLFEPLENYNEFASVFACQISADEPFWHDELKLNDGSILRLRGLNSTLISNKLDNDAEYKLILGTIQAACPNEDGVEYITLCHHPPDWLRDQGNIEDYLNSRVKIQLFGHKHRFRTTPIGQSLRISAGAMHPDEREPNWQPRYNIISLAISKNDQIRNLNIEIHPRVWSDSEKLFIGEMNAKEKTYSTYTFELDPWSPPIPMNIEAVQSNIANDDENNEPASQDISGVTKQEGRPMNRNRRLTYRFYTLPYNVRLMVVQNLKLVQDDDRNVPDTRLFERYFKRAKDNNILEQLWNEVEKAHTDNRFNDNPFTGE